MIEVSFRIEPGEFNTKRLVQYGRCDGEPDTVEEIESGCSLGRLVRIPNSAGTVFKVLDGTNPEVQYITPPTIGKTYNCVKVASRVWPMAGVQSGGKFAGSAVCRYEIHWQEVGDVT